jgi:hypothetical protein
MPETPLNLAAICIPCERGFHARQELDSIEHLGDSIHQQKVTLAGEGWAGNGGAERIRVTRTAALPPCRNKLALRSNVGCPWQGE